MFDVSDNPHRRLNPLTDDYVLVSPHRAKRPWQGAQEVVPGADIPLYDPKCFLCPGNKRITGDDNPSYESTFVFTNDFPAVRMDDPDYVAEEQSDKKSRLMKIEGVKGTAYVICFSPNHALTLPYLPVEEVRKVVDAWAALYDDVQRQRIEENAPFKYVQIFENKGAAMGCLNPHPHCQAWCLDTVPNVVSKESTNMEKYLKENKTHLLADYVELELAEKERIVLENDSFVVVVPFWALWPFETLVLSKTHLRSFQDFSAKQKDDFADALKRLTTRYDNLFLTSFPYSLGIHQAPVVGDESEKDVYWFHMHFYPPLLRSATVKKFQVGFEMLGEAQRDLTPEQAAQRLRDLSEVHYTAK